MKKLLYTLALIFCSTQLFASHGMGGEITWVCSGNSYVFRVKFYRDCQGIPGPGSMSLSTNVPGVPSIPLNLVSQTDISPTGSVGSGPPGKPCPTCASPADGAVEEFYFVSVPTPLPGTPPVTGWAFWWGTCCRSGSLTNVTNGGNYGFSLKAKMYPYGGFVAGQCKDASPAFAEKPSTIICTGYPFTFNHNAVDPELDSLVYAWDVLIDDSSYPQGTVPFAPGYSVNSQMPSTFQNPLNVPAVINPITGEISYTSFTSGYFATCIKVSAYKCNSLAAEIWREINVVLLPGCVIPPSNVPNNPPIPTPPFPDPITGFPNQSYNTTVYAGDTLRFTLPATDPDPHPVLGVQSITFNASGGEFGAGFINPNAGCYIPPCATLSPPPPVGPTIFGTQVSFIWPVKCQHMGADTNCTRISNVYNFVLRINDNYCPANGIKVATISVTVKRPPKLLPPRLKCVSVLNPLGDVELSWAPPAPRDTHYTFAQYEVWASLTGVVGSFVKLDSVYGNLNKYYQTSLIIPAAKQVAVLGTHAQNTSLYFQMYTRCGCDSDSLSVESNVARSMKTNAIQAGTSVDVTWNPVHNPLLATSHNKYYIYKEFPIGTWALIDSTTHPDFNYTDPTTNTICDDSITYRIQTGDDSLLCTSWSSFAGVRVINPAPVATITPLNPAFCAGQNVVLTANAGGSSYQWSGGSSATTQAITATTAGTYTVTITYMPGGCTSTTSTIVVVNAVPTASIGGTTSICVGQNTNLQFNFTGTGPWTYSYNGPAGIVGPLNTAVTPVNIPVSPSATFNYTLVSVNNTTCPGVVAGNANIVVNTLPQATIAGTAAICAGQATNLQITFSNAPGPWTYSYNSPTGVVGPLVAATSPVNIPVSPLSTFNYTLVNVSNANCTGSIIGNANITVNTLPQASLAGTTAICVGQATNLQITFSNAPGPWTYSYNSPTGVVGPLVAATSPVNIPVGPLSTFNYTLVNVSNVNCVGSVVGNANITVNTIPTAAISGNPVICNGQVANITFTFGGAPGPWTYTYWNGSANVGPLVAATSPVNVPVSPSVTTNYTLVNVSNINCAGTIGGLSTVTVNPLPTAQISGTQAICSGQPANLNITFTGTGPWTYSYLAGATLVGPFVSPVSPAVISVTPSATTTYSLPPTVSDANCTGTNTSGNATVTVNPLPTALITGNATICAGTPTNLTFNFTGTAPFVFSYTDGINIFGPINTSTNPHVIPVAPTASTNYSLIGTVTGAGCVGPVAGLVSITVNQLPTATITGTNTICDGTATNLTVTFANAPGPYTYSYTANAVSNGPYTTGSNPAVISVSPGVNTTYTLTSINNANCTGVVTGSAAVISVIPLPTATLTGTTDICTGQSTNITVTFTGQAPFTYSYLSGATVNGPFTTSTNPITISVTPGVTTNYGLTASVIGNGCTGNAAGTALITVHPLPTATISFNPTICAGEQTDLSIAFTGTPPFEYRYTDGTNTFGPFTTLNNPEIITVSPLTTKTYTVTTIEDGNNCSGTTSGQSLVTVNPLPTAHITGTATICDGDQTNLTINFTGTAPFTYSYFDGTNTVGPLNTNNNSVLIPVSPTSTTTYTVTAVDDDNCAGTTSGTAIITVNPLPTAVLSGNPVICNGQNAGLTVNFTGTAPFVFSYTDGTNVFGPITASNNPATVTVSPIITTNYTMAGNVTGAGCIGAASGGAIVTVNQLPTATVSGAPIICKGDQTSFNITFTGAPPFTYIYSNGSISFGPFTTSNLIESISVSPIITTTYSVTAINDDNCTGTASGQALVTVHPLPTALISGTTGICNGSSTNLLVNFTGTGPYTYTYSNGTVTYGPFTTNNDPETITVLPSSTTTYTVTSIGDANCTGTVSGSAVITVYTIPTAFISDNTAICKGGASSFKITFNNGVAPYTYRYFDGTSVFGPFTTSNNPEVVNVSPISTKNYTLVNVNDLHCNGTVSGTATVTVNELPVPVIIGVNVICDGDNTVFNAGSYINYQWSNGATTQTITVSIAGPYSVIVTDIYGCVGSDSEILTVNETPVVSFTNDTSMTCEAPIINFINTSTYPAGSQFQWDFGDASKSELENPSHLYALPGTYPITLIITTQAGCADTLTKDVDIQFYPLAEAKFTHDPTVTSVFNATVNFVDQSKYAVTRNWDFGDGFQSSEPNPKHYFEDIGKFKIVLTVTNIAGCPDRYEQEVLITPFYVPNAFTPNGDGNNDVFFDAGYIMDVENYNMTIFSRWGQKVYENDDYRKFWNGYDKNGKLQPEGVYVYSIKVKTPSGKPYEYQGSVTLLR